MYSLIWGKEREFVLSTDLVFECNTNPFNNGWNICENRDPWTDLFMPVHRVAMISDWVQQTNTFLLPKSIKKSQLFVLLNQNPQNLSRQFRKDDDAMELEKHSRCWCKKVNSHSVLFAPTPTVYCIPHCVGFDLFALKVTVPTTHIC